MIKKTLIILPFLFFNLSSNSSAGPRRNAVISECTRHSPKVILAEKVQIAQPGEIVLNEITIRNADSCSCPTSCFQLTSGYHPPNSYPEPANGIRIGSTSLTKSDGSPANPVCLAPGEELDATLTIKVLEDQSPPGYITPVVFADRHSRDLPCYSYYESSWGPGCFEREGGALCLGMDYSQCHNFVYPAAEGE